MRRGLLAVVLVMLAAPVVLGEEYCHFGQTSFPDTLLGPPTLPGNLLSFPDQVRSGTVTHVQIGNPLGKDPDAFGRIAWDAGSDRSFNADDTKVIVRRVGTGSSPQARIYSIAWPGFTVAFLGAIVRPDTGGQLDVQGAPWHPTNTAKLIVSRSKKVWEYDLSVANVYTDANPAGKAPLTDFKDYSNISTTGSMSNRLMIDQSGNPLVVADDSFDAVTGQDNWNRLLRYNRSTAAVDVDVNLSYIYGIVSGKNIHGADLDISGDFVVMTIQGVSPDRHVYQISTGYGGVWTTGTITATSGSPTVTGSGTGWTNSTCRVGDKIHVQADWIIPKDAVNGHYTLYTVQSISGQTITLSTNYAGKNPGAGLAYGCGQVRDFFRSGHSGLGDGVEYQFEVDEVGKAKFWVRRVSLAGVIAGTEALGSAAAPSAGTRLFTMPYYYSTGLGTASGEDHYISHAISDRVRSSLGLSVPQVPWGESFFVNFYFDTALSGAWTLHSGTSGVDAVYKKTTAAGTLAGSQLADRSVLLTNITSIPDGTTASQWFNSGTILYVATKDFTTALNNIRVLRPGLMANSIFQIFPNQSTWRRVAYSRWLGSSAQIFNTHGVFQLGETGTVGVYNSIFGDYANVALFGDYKSALFSIPAPSGPVPTASPAALVSPAPLTSPVSGQPIVAGAC